ncbi:MAG: hypothetical protein GY946_28515 [bacterium]|nr:hypothetical protein [bacterium]
MKRLAFFLLLLILLPGYTCGSGGAPSSPAVVWFDPPSLSVPPLSEFELELWVSTSGTAQAYEFSIQYDNSRILLYEVVPHSDFDDDGQFFVEPQIDFPTGTVNGVVDLRHGFEMGASGNFRVATLSGWSFGSGDATVTLSDGGIASEDGLELTITTADAVITVTP